MKDKEEKALLEKWFKCDMNAVPPMYVLQPISYHIPNSLCHDADQRKVALQNWSQVFSQIQDILRREAKTLHGAASIGELHKYFMSVKTAFCIGHKMKNLHLSQEDYTQRNHE